jgi:hypothetical protein
MFCCKILSYSPPLGIAPSFWTSSVHVAWPKLLVNLRLWIVMFKPHLPHYSYGIKHPKDVWIRFPRSIPCDTRGCLRLRCKVLIRHLRLSRLSRAMWSYGRNWRGTHHLFRILHPPHLREMPRSLSASPITLHFRYLAKQSARGWRSFFRSSIVWSLDISDWQKTEAENTTLEKGEGSPTLFSNNI